MWIEAFLRYVRYEKNYSSHTVLSYKRDVNQFAVHLSRATDGVVIENADRDNIREWVATMIENGVSSRTVARKLSALRLFYSFLIKYGVIADTPIHDISLPKIKKTLPVFVRPSLMDEVLDAQNGDSDFSTIRDNLIILLFYMTGIRRAELIALRDIDVDVLSRQIKVTGKRNRQRLVPFGEELAEMIDEYRRLRVAEVGNENSAFFVKDNGEELYPMYVQRLVHERLVSVTTLSRRSPHVLRHTFASAMLNNGAELNSVKELLGHRSLASTQVYTHVTFEELKHNYKQAHPRAAKKGGFYGN